MRILGISAFYHDSAAALVEDGRIISAAQEERFTRKKHDDDFPHHAISYCLTEAGISAADIDHVVFYEKPFIKFERLIETYLMFAPRGFTSFLKAMPLWLKEKLFLKRLMVEKLGEIAEDVDWRSKLLFAEHHQSHAASAYYPSPFDEALVLTMDGVGEWATTSLGVGRGDSLTIEREIRFPHSLGLLYSAFTYYTGFKVNSGEYKVMGLAPYGRPTFTQTILDNIIDIREDGSFKLDLSYFDFCTGLTMTNSRFDRLFGGPPRGPEELLTQHHMDLAASIQEVTEIAVMCMATALAKETGIKNLCLAGGVALNCVANGKLQRSGQFDRIWVQPAAGDAGGALGAALAGYHDHFGLARPAREGLDAMVGSYLGPSFSPEQIETELTAAGAVFTALSDSEVIARTTDALTEGKAVGWMQGRMEFGPRALGNRSILGDPRSPTMQKLLNLKVKYRESFRPFAPSVLREDLEDWFELDCDSPYMLMVADVVEKRRRQMTPEEEALFGIDKLNVARSEIPAVTHVDFSARIQTVHQETNPQYHALLSAFKAATGCPVLVNTSFNVRGEPIVCTPSDAFRCFMGTDIEVLVCGNAFLSKDDQDPALKQDYKDRFELD
ncbi:carbamoyltransferase family protein [Limibacillus halophilus]|uniref:Carbamoyltransferase n=1 Tax=Limibacillus halophilus TaxID=1579333 RepID=A0A839SVS0_9PROT|nr:carbamoyltransferase [Limibacillus halophilus]MBB3066897.1 carbamoyltransferase [Limibacillus halophilus]